MVIKFISHHAPFILNLFIHKDIVKSSPNDREHSQFLENRKTDRPLYPAFRRWAGFKRA
jgi:hypothetical protein